MSVTETVELTEEQLALLGAPHFAHLGTICSDGGPAVSVVWVDVEDGLIRINSAEGRLKVQNMRRNPQVSLSVHDQEMPYRTTSIRGEVVEMTHEGADEHIDSLAKDYTGVDRYPGHARGEQRVLIKIRPTKAVGPSF